MTTETTKVPGHPRYPHIKVQLSGEDGNAFFIIGRVAQALRRGKVGAKEIDEFTAQAMSGDYDNVLQTCMRWCTIS
jgi:hypothetical protein